MLQTWPQLTYDDLVEYEGIYEYKNGLTVQIAASPADTTLFALLGGEKYPLTAVGDSDAFPNAANQRVLFTRDDSRHVSGYRLPDDGTDRVFRLLSADGDFPSETWYPRLAALKPDYEYRYAVPDARDDGIPVGSSRMAIELRRRTFFVFALYYHLVKNGAKQRPPGRVPLPCGTKQKWRRQDLFIQPISTMNATEAIEQRDEAIAKLRDLIKDIRVTMMTTVDPSDGALRSRPMYMQEAEFDGTLWFFTGVHSPKVHEIDEAHDVNLAFADPDDNRYVSVSGKARLVQDRARAEALWSPALKAWFPKGLDDPELGLLRVDVEKAEYWTSASSLVTVLTGFVKAVTTGKRQEDPPLGENEKLRM